MNDIRLFPNDEDEVVHGLRSLYAAPAGDSYWNELESRIMARVATVVIACVTLAGCRRRLPLSSSSSPNAR